jgi:hypothetical protein
LSASLQREKVIILDLDSVAPGSKLAAHCIAPDPDAASKLPAQIWFFTVHGASEDWTYFDKTIPGHESEQYSFAAFMSDHGVGTITIDAFGRGESSFPLHGSQLTLETIAQAHAEGADRIRSMLVEGSLRVDVPAQEDLYFVGLGHSGGGAEVIIQQGLFRTFDAVVVMSMPANDFKIPSSGQEALKTSIETLDNGLIHVPVRPAVSLEGAFTPDTPQDIRDAFPGGRPFPASHLLNMKNGTLAPYAMKITCPTLVTQGDVDLAGSPLKEQTRYGGDDVTVLIQQNCRHNVWASPARVDLMTSIWNWAVSRATYR